MARLKLKPRGNAPERTSGRPPVRSGGVHRRPTLAEAKAERASRPPTQGQGGLAKTGRAAAPSKSFDGKPGAARAGPSAGAAAPLQGRTAAARPRARPAPVPPPPRAQPATGAPATTAAAVGVRLSKRLTELGLASRREADEWIEAGRVRVNGRLAVLGQRVGTDDRIDIDAQARREQAGKLTILLHKPVGYVSGQAEDGHRPASLLVTPANRWRDDATPMRLPPGLLRGLAPAGRLDIDSTGLLVLTQDGRIAKRLIGDDARVEKEYLVRVRARGPLRPDALDLLRDGLELDGVRLRPAKVSWQNEDQLRFVLREGRKRQIRRMCELVGLEVIGLKRVRIGSVVLGGLPVGQWRLLRGDEKF